MIAQNNKLKKLTRGREGALDAPMKFSRNFRRKTPRRPIYGTRDPRRVKGVNNDVTLFRRPKVEVYQTKTVDAGVLIFLIYNR